MTLGQRDPLRADRVARHRGIEDLIPRHRIRRGRWLRGTGHRKDSHSKCRRHPGRDAPGCGRAPLRPLSSSATLPDGLLRYGLKRREPASLLGHNAAWLWARPPRRPLRGPCGHAARGRGVLRSCGRNPWNPGVLHRHAAGRSGMGRGVRVGGLSNVAAAVAVARGSAWVASYDEWGSLNESARQRARIVLLTHHDDPIGKWGPVTRHPVSELAGPLRNTRTEGATGDPDGASSLLCLHPRRGAQLHESHSGQLRGLRARASTGRTSSGWLQTAYGLEVHDDQLVRIERALRERELMWAQRRVVADAYQKARDGVRARLRRLGFPVEAPPRKWLPRGGVTAHLRVGGRRRRVDHSSRRSWRGQAFACWLVGCCVGVRW